MSNINNYGVDMNNDVPFCSELSCEKAATIQGGASAQVFTGTNFSGTSSKVFSSNISFFNRNVFNDKISSIKVFSGEWAFWTNGGFNGRAIILKPGEYSDLRKFFGGVYNDTISSAQIRVQ